MAQEIPLLIASGGTASAARGALALKGVAQEVAERIASKAGFGTASSHSCTVVRIYGDKVGRVFLKIYHSIIVLIA